MGLPGRRLTAEEGRRLAGSEGRTGARRRARRFADGADRAGARLRDGIGGRAGLRDVPVVGEREELTSDEDWSLLD